MGFISPISNLLPFFKKPYFLPLSDKFQIGGPNSLRGFGVSGVGARSTEISTRLQPLNKLTDEYLQNNFKEEVDSMSPRAKPRPTSSFNFFDIYENRDSVSINALNNELVSLPYDELSKQAHSSRLKKVKHNITGDSLGGEGKNTFLFLLSVPLPYKLLSDFNARAFLFFNSGTISTFNYWNSKERSSFNEAQKNSIWGSFRSSFGGGFSAVLGNSVRFEATYSLPVTHAHHDVTRNFQCGLSMNIN